MTAPYVTVMAVLKQAGLWFRELGEAPSGTADGANKVFVVARKPLADMDADDTVTEADVSAYVAGLPVMVASVNETTGALTLVSAPATNAAVTIDYAYSFFTSDDVAAVIEEAQEVIDDVMGRVVSVPYTTVPKSIRRIARFYAAGLLLTDEYGLQGVSDEMTKQGKGFITQAETWLAAYREQILTNAPNSGGIAVPHTGTDRRLFERRDDTTGNWQPLADETFTINEAS